MTNFEYYKNKLQQLTDETIKIGIHNGEPIDCYKIGCYECDLHGNCWRTEFVKWLCQEYMPHVDWSKIEVDTPILVSMDGKLWYRRYFAKFKDGEVYAFQSGATSWSSKERSIAWEYVKLKEEE